MVKAAEIKAFINSITPNNWIPSLDDKELKELFENGFRKRPSDLQSSLYIQVFIIDEKNDVDYQRLGECHGPMRFYDGFSSCALWVYPHEGYEQDMISWQGTIIHELAHIAVNRLVSLKLKPYKTNRPLVNASVDLDENQHGPTFQKAVRRMLYRAYQVYGDELEDTLIETEIDLDKYQYFLDE